MAISTVVEKKVLCFGEVLLRMSPQVNAAWIHQHSMDTYVGGAELNVARALANWHLPSKFITAMPDHSLSSDLINYLTTNNIDTSSIYISGKRLGIYYLPQGKDLKNGGVIYDRANSSFSELKPGMINWEEALKDVCWLHISAINPALNDNVREVCKELLGIASQKGITISLDLNYREKLWKYGKEPSDVLPELAHYCDLIMGNIWAADKLLGIPLKENLLSEKNKTDYIEHSRHTSQAICEKFPKVKNVANTFRFDKGKDGVSYFATLFNDKNFMVSEEILADGIVDKIGSGDCFMAGLIYGFNNGIELKELLQFSATAAVGKMYESNDATKQSVQQILFNAGIKNGKHEMSRKQQSLEIILNQKVLPLYFHSSREVSINILKALYEAGIRTIEYTNRGKEALENFKALVSFRNSGFNDLQLGIGTIKSASEATAFIKEGADFLISPGFIPEVADAANAAQVLWIPGCMTVSEIIAAEKSGAKLVKIFPGNVLGPSYVSTIKDIFPELKFMPTGGVELNEENINAWFDAGVVAVGLGSKLISKNLCEQENYNEIKVRAAEVLQIVQSIKNKKI